MKMFKKIIFLCLLILIIFTLFLFFKICFEIYTPVDSKGEEKTFIINQGDGVLTIAQNLEEKKLIRNKYIFGFYLFLRGEQGKLKAGQYRISSAMNVPEIADIIISGKIEQRKITIIEGWNLINIAEYFLVNNIIENKDDFYKIVGYPRVDYNLKPDKPRPIEFNNYLFLKEKPKNISMEGYLFPDTYYVQADASAEEIVFVLLNNFDKKFSSEIREEIKEQGKTIFEILVMASLIEKEVRSKEDMEIVSGILWKRLKIGMPLQVDATVVYLTGKKSTRVSIAETQIDSPYNTYKYRGLPIGPICNPGMNSILAAIRPKESPYFFYLSTPEGETLYSRTLEEHNIKKFKYLK